jgi:hypothetical protein
LDLVKPAKSNISFFIYNSILFYIIHSPLGQL